MLLVPITHGISYILNKVLYISNSIWKKTRQQHKFVHIIQVDAPLFNDKTFPIKDLPSVQSSTYLLIKIINIFYKQLEKYKY